MTNDPRGAREIGATTGESRDAWAVDGFAPLPGDCVQLPSVAPPGERTSTPAPTSATVETVYLCSEAAGEQLVRWSWIVLADGRLLEIAPRGCALYDPPTVLERGTGRFLELAAQDGALVRFEERVRAGEWEARPVRLTLQRRRWRLTATGTVTAQRLGPTPKGGWGQLRTRGRPVDAAPVTSAAGSPWQSGAPHAPELGDDLDVYFTLAGESDAMMLGLGVWMTDIALAFGRRLGETPAAAGLRVLAESPTVVD